jgi:hypothetical protein
MVSSNCPHCLFYHKKSYSICYICHKVYQETFIERIKAWLKIRTRLAVQLANSFPSIQKKSRANLAVTAKQIIAQIGSLRLGIKS